MIRRIWRGYTRPENADAYEHLLDSLMFPAVEGMRLPGYKSMELLRRDTDDGEIEFVWVINFDSTKDLSPLRAEGNDPVSVPRAAQKLLIRWDERATYYDMRQSRPRG
ncbi:hypothetical protein SAMN04488498_10190 [Mesorhizobium albiziae]|uniref:Antibiotic biosynthesis monooxygenase n=1 Tax=Neomesorhizobium albiziae TaxID=335020 RepID=A0A1I3UZP0_9HYPH|nr:antibiotic biosynthesis monooxygenase [Mesorhizobium albiziae]GLS28551.1 hypothetical protein GCM10007937_02580 [Mesorhizobium albiziae]SFJ88159.1 hypothetical protein SAMN04488498_10190 [Mesorhizobium albiziae]